jgi:hypothetical protein
LPSFALKRTAAASSAILTASNLLNIAPKRVAAGGFFGGLRGNTAAPSNTNMRVLARLTLSAIDAIDRILPIGGTLSGVRYYLARYLINLAQTEAHNKARK